MDGVIYIGEPRDVYIGTVNANGTPVLTTGGLTNRNTGAAVNNATVTAQVREESEDETGTAIGGSVSLSYVATSSGHYLGTIPAATTALLTKGTVYDVWVNESAGQVKRQLKYKAQYRGAT